MILFLFRSSRDCDREEALSSLIDSSVIDDLIFIRDCGLKKSLLSHSSLSQEETFSSARVDDSEMGIYNNFQYRRDVVVLNILKNDSDSVNHRELRKSSSHSISSVLRLTVSTLKLFVCMTN
jgi:hypothetical protein